MLLNLLLEFIPNLPRPPRLHSRIEDHINLLQRPSRGFGVHEEDMEAHHAAEYPKDDVCSPLDVVEGWRDEIGQREVEDPVCGRREPDPLGAVF